MKRFLEATEIPNNAIILDTRTAAQYASSHVAGARLIDFVTQKFVIRDITGLTQFQSVLQDVIRGVGLEAGATIVVYDNGHESRSARVAWALEYAGFEVGILRDGFPACISAGLPLETSTPVWMPSQYVLHVKAELLATADQIKTQIVTGHTTVIDARSADEYQTSHIPGAKNFDWNRVMSANGYLPNDALTQALIHIPNDQELIVHCQSGARSAALYQALRNCGYMVKNYLGSMNEWVSQPDLTTESGAGQTF